MSLNTSKATPKDSIPFKILKENCDILGYKLVIDFNHSLKTETFPNNQKYAGVSPIFKKQDTLNISNYCPISILVALFRKYNLNFKQDNF